jgi:ubiquinone/menaquinone biosynthesis C-methylase UbiE
MPLGGGVDRGRGPKGPCAENIEPASGRTGSMDFYSRVIFPYLCDLALKQPFVAKHRHILLRQAGGEILEIGFGTGLNLPHYPEQVRKITVVDPNPGMRRKAEKRIEQSGIDVELRLGSGEQLPFEEDTFDCVVSTFTLCSIEDVCRAIGEVYRVLKPGGRFLFLEHGLSPDPKVRKWQHRLNWLQRRVGDNCRLDRNMRELVSSRPFSSVEVSEFYLEKGPRTHGYIYQGAATK